jgi:hypothetical protein
MVLKLLFHIGFENSSPNQPYQPLSRSSEVLVIAYRNITERSRLYEPHHLMPSQSGITPTQNWKREFAITGLPIRSCL